MIDSPNILIVVNVDWFFWSHRLPVAEAARARGARVVIAAADTGRAAAIRECGFEFIPIPLSRKGRNPIIELHTLDRLIRTYRPIRPDLVHHVTIEPIIYGSIAARLAGTRAVINAVTGLGFSFSTNRRAAVWRPLVKLLYQLALRLPMGCTVFQNPEDRDYFVGEHLVAVERSALIPSRRRIPRFVDRDVAGEDAVGQGCGPVRGGGTPAPLAANGVDIRSGRAD